MYVRLFFLLEESIALLPRCVIARQDINVLRMTLGYDDVKQTPPHVTASVNEGCVRRRHQDKRQQSDMLCKALVLLVITLEVFPLPTLHAAVYALLCPVLRHIAGIEDKERLVMTQQLGIGDSILTLAERQIIYGVEDIRLAHAVAADKAIQLRREIQRRLPDILEIND